jgi:hypothetical protein
MASFSSVVDSGSRRQSISGKLTGAAAPPGLVRAVPVRVAVLYLARPSNEATHA